MLFRSTFIIKGTCKLKEGNKCGSSSDCVSGLVCHSNVCVNPIGSRCNGPQDTSCPKDYRCIQSCGPPISRGNEPPPPYYCEANEIANKPRNCPICLAENTQISTPTGMVNVKDIKIGARVWSLNKKGEKIISAIINVSNSAAPKTHRVSHLVLADGRELWVSPSHPTINGLSVRDLRAGNTYDGSLVKSRKLVPYWDTKTYDILPDSDTGYYWANKILLGSTLTRN